MLFCEDREVVGERVGDFCVTVEGGAFGASARGLPPAGFAATTGLTTALCAAILPFEVDFALAAGFAGTDGVRTLLVRAADSLPARLRAAGGAATGSLRRRSRYRIRRPGPRCRGPLPDAGAAPAADNPVRVLLTRSAAATPPAREEQFGLLVEPGADTVQHRGDMLAHRRPVQAIATELDILRPELGTLGSVPGCPVTGIPTAIKFAGKVATSVL